MNTNKTVTVQDMINSLMQFPMDAPVEIAIGQYNKAYPVAYVAPEQTLQFNTSCVRIQASLPVDYSSKTYMGTYTKKL